MARRHYTKTDVDTRQLGNDIITLGNEVISNDTGVVSMDITRTIGRERVEEVTIELQIHPAKDTVFGGGYNVPMDSADSNE